MKNFLFAVYCTVFFSCSENIEQINDTNVRTEKSYDDLKFSQHDRLREKFGNALSKALHDNIELRSFIKSEAIKQFNKDYDVLYHLVKDKTLKSNGYSKTVGQSYATFRSTLLNYFSSESELIDIENSLPLLTIFVPKLPENSFSAENWDISDTENSPVVAISMDENNSVPMIAYNGEKFVLNPEQIPNFPVVVLKNSERLITNQMHGYSSLNTNELSTGTNLSFKFIDNNLDPSVIAGEPNFVNNTEQVATSTISNVSFDFLFIPGRELTVAPFLINAYNSFNGQVINPWQRDNVYYGLTSSNSSGILTNKYKEAITYMKFEGTPTNVYNTLSQRQPGNPDPGFNEITFFTPEPGPAWTEGNFEFRVWCTHGSKTMADGTNTYRVFTVSPSELFNVTYTNIFPTSLSWRLLRRGVWGATIQSVKPMDFYSNGFNGQRLIFFDWDLSDYANNFSYKFEELDISVTNDISESQTTRHNLNAEINITTGEKTKYGFKFGATIEDIKTTIRKWNWTSAGKNDLGIQSVHFKDNVVNKHPNTNQYYPNVFQTGFVTFEVRPLQVNF